jgi:hypothetical protein
MAASRDEAALATQRLPEATTETQLVVGWERSVGLRAPPAPRQGPLVPNGTGYLLAVGPSSLRLHPRLGPWARWSPVLTLPVVAVTPFLLVPAPYGPLGAALVAALACWLPWAALGAATRARLKRHLSGAPLLTSWRQAKPGQVVRLEGTVPEQPTAPSLFSNSPTVLATSQYGGATETRGIDFHVRLADGDEVHLSAREALLLGRSRRIRGLPACGPLAVSLDGGEPRLASALLAVQGWVGRLLRFSARELTLAPGDRVELCGTVDHQPEPDKKGQGGFGRGPAFRTVLIPSAGIPVLVRKIPAKVPETAVSD